MRVIHSYLKYIFILIFIQACKENTDHANDKNVFLVREPLIVPLSLKEGYAKNKITSDSITPLINSLGEKIKTGTPVPFTGVVIDPQKFNKPKTSTVGSPPEIMIADNVYSLPEKLEVIKVDTNRLKKIKAGEGDQSYVLRNSFGVLSTGVLRPVTGRKMPFSEPHPIKTLPLRYKDAATTNVQYLDVEQGLSYSFVYDLLEDRRGNFWFGMDGTGVSKYDGVSFTHYTEKEGLSNNIVKYILEDRKGNLWFATEKGVNKFDGENFEQFTEKEGLPDNLVLSMYEDSNGSLWFGTSKGVTKYDGKNFTTYTVKEGLPSNTVYSIIEDKNGNMWFGTQKGIVKYDGKTITCISNKDGLLNNIVMSMLQDVNGNFWVVTFPDGINKFDGKTITHYTVKEGLSSEVIWSMIEDSKGDLWFGTNFGGIKKFDGKNFMHYSLKEGLSNTKVRKIVEDKNGNIWFATDGGGINKLSSESFNNIIPNEFIANNRGRPIIKDKNGNIWIGTEGGGVGKYHADNSDRRKGSFIYYTSKDGMPQGQRSIMQDRKGNIWIGTVGGGAVKLNGKTLTKYTVDEGICDNTIYCIAEDRNENIWFGSSDNGIDKFNGKNFTHYSEKDGLSAKRIFSIMEDSHANLWFCTEGSGISKFDGTNITTYTESEGLFAKSVTSVTEDKHGDLWFGTLGAGVCRFDGKNFIYYTESDGLSNNNIWSIIRDSSGQIWAGSDKGLNLFIPDSNNNYAIYKFGLEDGLKALDFNLRSVCIDDNNRIWWGTGKNVITKNLNEPFKTYDLKTPKLNYIEINGQYFDYRNLTDSLRKKISFSNVTPFNNYPENLELSYKENHLTFHFSAIDWSAPGKIKYSYQLIGLNENWSNPSEEPIADYRNLSYGKYELQVKAVGQSQKWTQPLSYKFVIRPAWWQTWWFKASVIIFAVLISIYTSWSIYLYRLRKQRMLLEKQIAIQNERQRISSEMHDDIGASLSSVRLLTEMTKNKLKDTGTTNEIDNIYESVGDISTKMQEVIWSLSVENDHLSNLIYFIQKQVRSMLEHYPGKLNFELPAVIPDVELSGEIRRNIYLVVKEAVHNIIKHSGADKIKFTIAFEEKLIITVSDNGKGMNAENYNTGNGWKNMQQRMKKLNGVFLTKNEEGLTLIFEIPIKPAL